MTTTTGGRILWEIIQKPISLLPREALNLRDNVKMKRRKIAVPEVNTNLQSIPILVINKIAKIKIRMKHAIETIFGR